MNHNKGGTVKPVTVVDTFHRRNADAHVYDRRDPVTPALVEYEQERRRQLVLRLPVADRAPVIALMRARGEL